MELVSLQALCDKKFIVL